jgi:hypothetical protein
VNIWATILQLIQQGKIGPSNLALVRLLAVDLRQIGGGTDLTPDQVRALISAAIPVVELVATTAFPELKPLEAVVNVMLALSRPPTFEEEQRLNDRASAQGNT